MLDSTVIERIGRYLTPDDKLKNSSKILAELIESKAFKASFRKRCENRLLRLKKKPSYYKKFAKPNIEVMKDAIEEVIRKKGEGPPRTYSVLQDKITKLEFLFKKIMILKKPQKLAESSEAPPDPAVYGSSAHQNPEEDRSNNI